MLAIGFFGNERAKKISKQADARFASMSGSGRLDDTVDPGACTGGEGKGMLRIEAGGQGRKRKQSAKTRQIFRLEVTWKPDAPTVCRNILDGGPPRHGGFVEVGRHLPLVTLA